MRATASSRCFIGVPPIHFTTSSRRRRSNNRSAVTMPRPDDHALGFGDDFAGLGHPPCWQPSERVPGVEIIKVLPTVGNPAVLDLEDDPAANVQVLAVPLSAVVTNANHAAVITRKQVLQRGLERASRLSPVPAELGKGRLAGRTASRAWA